MTLEAEIEEKERYIRLNAMVDDSIIKDLEFQRRKSLRYAELNTAFGSDGELAKAQMAEAERLDRMIHWVKTGERLPEPGEK